MTRQYKYWYKETVYECPVCGRESVRWRERQYGERPDDYFKRHLLFHVYDYCNE